MTQVAFEWRKAGAPAAGSPGAGAPGAAASTPPRWGAPEVGGFSTRFREKVEMFEKCSQLY